ncbi:MAG: hypothetical protein KF764_08645 [Labilithrix sp.]|nr:hypothetical protein [Labilithrix sp.]
MTAQDIAKLVTNALATVAIVLFVLLASMPWEFGAVALAALLMPSALPTLIDGLRTMRSSSSSSDKAPPKGPSVLGLVFVFCAAAQLAPVIVPATAGCAQAKTPREQARSVVLTVAYGVRQADLACASVAIARDDVALADECARHVDVARELLLAAEDGVDAWDAAAAERLPCAVQSAASALTSIVDAIQRAGGKPPPGAVDALRIAPMLAGACGGA